MIPESHKNNPVKPVSKSPPKEIPHQRQSFIFKLQHECTIKRPRHDPS